MDVFQTDIYFWARMASPWLLYRPVHSRMVSGRQFHKIIFVAEKLRETKTVSARFRTWIALLTNNLCYCVLT